MAREDLTFAERAPAPLEPLAADMVTVPHLGELGRRVARRTWAEGMPRWFWPEGVALLGLARFSRVAGADDADLHRWVGRQISDGVAVEHVNDLAPGIAALYLDPVGYLEAMGPLARWVLEDPAATRARNGALEHWPGGVWADTMFMAGAFLARYGRASEDIEMLDEAGRQLVRHAEILQDPATGLFAHGAHRGETIWNFWGRANAWAALAAVEFLEASVGLEAELCLRAEVADRLVLQLSALADLQPAHGVWDVLVDGPAETAGLLETSAAAGLAAAMLRAGNVVANLPRAITEAGWRSVRGALAYVDDEGALTRVSAGTVLQLVAFGYSAIRDDRPQLWGQGLALQAVAAAMGGLPSSPDGNRP